MNTIIAIAVTSIVIALLALTKYVLVPKIQDSREHDRIQAKVLDNDYDEMQQRKKEKELMYLNETHYVKKSEINDYIDKRLDELVSRPDEFKGSAAKAAQAMKDLHKTLVSERKEKLLRDAGIENVYSILVKESGKLKRYDISAPKTIGKCFFKDMERGNKGFYADIISTKHEVLTKVHGSKQLVKIEKNDYLNYGYFYNNSVKEYKVTTVFFTDAYLIKVYHVKDWQNMDRTDMFYLTGLDVDEKSLSY